MDIFPKNNLYNTVPGAVAPVGLPTYATRARIGRGGGGRGGGGGGDMTDIQFGKIRRRDDCRLPFISGFIDWLPRNGIENVTENLRTSTSEGRNCRLIRL